MWKDNLVFHEIEFPQNGKKGHVEPWDYLLVIVNGSIMVHGRNAVLYVQDDVLPFIMFPVHVCMKTLN